MFRSSDCREHESHAVFAVNRPERTHRSTAIEGAGVYSDGVNSEFRDFIKSFRPMQRMGTLDDVANAAEYLASDLSAFVSGQHLILSGGAPA
jgi:3-oxoacyl-[acyl-carrier protein] reductase